jgi:hypothetical protein
MERYYNCPKKYSFGNMESRGKLPSYSPPISGQLDDFHLNYCMLEENTKTTISRKKVTTRPAKDLSPFNTEGDRKVSPSPKILRPGVTAGIAHDQKMRYPDSIDDICIKTISIQLGAYLVVRIQGWKILPISDRFCFLRGKLT